MVKKLHFAGALAIGMAAAPMAHATEHMVIVTGYSYFPSVIFANPGDTVRFINESGEEQTVVGKDVGWVIGPLANAEEGELLVTEETELSFFAAYQDDTSDDNNDFTDPTAGSDDYGTFEDAPIKAEITFDAPPT